MAGKGERPVRREMTGWYDPALLARTGVRVAISTVFGSFADKRETVAVANPIEPAPFDAELDYSTRGDAPFWFDFVADTGDGWDSTYAVARLLAEDRLSLDGATLERGRVLFMGGDQVYPTASRQDYGDRLLGPYDEAYQPGGTKRWPDGQRPDLYAIPGNHDWYDGLNAFLGLFCRRRGAYQDELGNPRRGRIIGGRQTKQVRSYFAVKLPGDWWLWGTDSQLDGYIDQPQVGYFEHAARCWMAPGSKLILCVGAPDWEYIGRDGPPESYASFSYLERLAGNAVDADGQPKGHRLRLVLTGDAHHYARFVEGDRTYLTCGGGGAFLHPTHQLDDKRFDWDYPEPGIAAPPGGGKVSRSYTIARNGEGSEALYPDRATSRRLTFLNLAFAVKNWRYSAMLLLPAYALFIWLLQLNAEVAQRTTLAGALGGRSLADAAWNYWVLVFATPLPLLLVVAALVGYRYFAEGAGLRRLLVGGAHALAQGAGVTLATCLVVRATEPWWVTVWGAAGSVALAAAVSAFVSATVMGLYLFVNLFFFGAHWNEAFSSFAHRGYKNFLRLRIDPDGTLTAWPIGLTKVPRDRAEPPANPPLSPHLIEPAIVIR